MRAVNVPQPTTGRCRAGPRRPRASRGCGLAASTGRSPGRRRTRRRAPATGRRRTVGRSRPDAGRRSGRGGPAAREARPPPKGRSRWRRVHGEADGRGRLGTGAVAAEGAPSGPGRPLDGVACLRTTPAVRPASPNACLPLRRPSTTRPGAAVGAWPWPGRANVAPAPAGRSCPPSAQVGFRCPTPVRWRWRPCAVCGVPDGAGLEFAGDGRRVWKETVGRIDGRGSRDGPDIAGAGTACPARGRSRDRAHAGHREHGRHRRG